MSSAIVAAGGQPIEAADLWLLPLRVLHFLINAPVLVFFFAMTAMLFRPPDLKCFPFDRIALVALVLLVGVRVCVNREAPKTFAATWPLAALMVLGLIGALTQPYQPQVWSLFIAKWAVPFLLFHIAGLLFRDQDSLQTLEIFLLCVLGYLALTSVLSLAGARGAIFPRYITDEAIGIHADRARGPFLQAVANGVCLNLLGLLAADSFRRGKLRGILAAGFFGAVPLALLATKTRAVWIASAASIGYLLFFGGSRKLRSVALAMCGLTVVCAAGVAISSADPDSLAERLVDRSPVEFRTQMYEAGWQMFTEKPVLGWGNEWSVQPEIEKRVSNFRPEYYVFHNTFLELAVYRGLLGFGLYVWLVVCLFRLSRSHGCFASGTFVDSQFRKLWPALLGVYLLNASAVVMNYQFVNALLFTIAGILAAHQKYSMAPDSALA